MAFKSWNSVVTVVCLAFLLLCCSFGNGVNLYGEVLPKDPRPFDGENLTLYCNLTNKNLIIDENSTQLYFTRAEVRVPPEYVEILSTRSIRLTYPITVEEDGDRITFVCYLAQQNRQNITVGTQWVKVDYRPAKVENVSCQVLNWENMTCTWDLRRPYRRMDQIRVSLNWSIGGGIEWSCPNLTSKTRCFWSGSPNTPSYKIFLPNSDYTVTVAVTNTARNVTEISKPFIISTKNLVKPDPAQWPRVEEKNATCLKLVWNHSEKVRNKLAVVKYFSEWNDGNWTSLPLQSFTTKTGEAHTTICGLIPFTNYTIGIGIWPEGDDGKPTGFMSDWVEIMDRTEPSVPEVGPEICAGCYTDLLTTANQRDILIYWKHIPPELRYSDIRGYHVDVPDSDVNMTSSCNLTMANQTWCRLTLQKDSDTTLQLYAVTSQNELSRNYSSITIPAKEPPKPSSLVVEVDSLWNGTLYVRWAGQPNTDSYLVVWCDGSKTVCDGEPKWSEELSGNTTHYSVNVGDKRHRQDKIIVGVVRRVERDGVVVSSGIKWAECLYTRGQVPRAPKNVGAAAESTSGSLSVWWDRSECTNAFVDHYLVYYCKTDHNNKCPPGQESKLRVHYDKGRVTLNNLEPKAAYRVRVSALAQGKEGEKSDPIFATAFEYAEASTDTILIAVLPASMVVVLVLLVTCFCKLGTYRTRTRELFVTSKSIPTPTPGPDLTHSGPYNNNHCVRNDNNPKSINPKTPLLGQEDSCDTDVSRPRHRGAGSTSERAALLAEEGKIPTSEERQVICVSNSDSNRGSGCSSDQGYVSMESGGASENERNAGSEQNDRGLQSTRAAGGHPPVQQLGPISDQGSCLPKDTSHGASGEKGFQPPSQKEYLPNDASSHSPRPSPHETGYQPHEERGNLSNDASCHRQPSQKGYQPNEQNGYLPNDASSRLSWPLSAHKGCAEAYPSSTPGYTKVITPALQQEKQSVPKASLMTPAQAPHQQRNNEIAGSFELEKPVQLTTFGGSSGYCPHPKEARGVVSSRCVSSTLCESAEHSCIHDDRTLEIIPRENSSGYVKETELSSLSPVNIGTNPWVRSGCTRENDLSSMDADARFEYIKETEFSSAAPSGSITTNPGASSAQGYVQEKDVRALPTVSIHPGVRSGCVKEKDLISTNPEHKSGYTKTELTSLPPPLSMSTKPKAGSGYIQEKDLSSLSAGSSCGPCCKHGPQELPALQRFSSLPPSTGVNTGVRPVYIQEKDLISTNPDGRSRHVGEAGLSVLPSSATMSSEPMAMSGYIQEKDLFSTNPEGRSGYITQETEFSSLAPSVSTSSNSVVKCGYVKEKDLIRSIKAGGMS